MQASGVRVQGSGVRVQGSGFRVQGSGFRGQGSRFRVQGAGFRGQGSGFRGQGSGFRVQVEDPHTGCLRVEQAVEGDGREGCDFVGCGEGDGYGVAPVHEREGLRAGLRAQGSGFRVEG